MTQHKYTRREVLKVGTAALAFPTLVTARALGTGRQGTAERNGARGSDWLRRSVASDHAKEPT